MQFKIHQNDGSCQTLRSQYSNPRIVVREYHTTLDTAASIVEKHAADYLMTVKQNAPGDL